MKQVATEIDVTRRRKFLRSAGKLLADAVNSGEPSGVIVLVKMADGSLWASNRGNISYADLLKQCLDWASDQAVERKLEELGIFARSR